MNPPIGLDGIDRRFISRVGTAFIPIHIHNDEVISLDLARWMGQSIVFYMEVYGKTEPTEFFNSPAERMILFVHHLFFKLELNPILPPEQSFSPHFPP